MRQLEIGDIIQKVSVNVHIHKKETVLYESTIDRVTKTLAFAGNWKFKRNPIWPDSNSYERTDQYVSHFEAYKLKIEDNTF